MIDKFHKKLKSLSGDKKSVLALVGGTTIAQGLNFIFSPIQTRLFTPEVFGELTVFNSITGIIGIIICLRYELAIVLPEDDDEGFNLLKLSFLFALLVSLISLLLFGFFGYQIYSLFNAKGLAKYWYYVPATLILTGIIQASNYWLTRKRNFTLLSYNKILPVLALNLVSIGLGFAGNRALGARLFSILLSNIVNIGVIAIVLVPEFKYKKVNAIKNIELIKKYKNSLLYDTWGALINNLSWMIVPILMNYYYGSYAAGQYSIGLRVIQLPISIIGSSIGQVFIKTASEKKSQKQLYDYAKGISFKLLKYTLPFGILMLVFGKWIFSFTFGTQWERSGVYVQILAPWAILWFISSPISSIYIIMQKQNISFFTSSLNLITRILSLYIGYRFKSDILGLVLFMISGLLVSGISIFLCFILAKKNDTVIVLSPSKN